MIVEELVWKEEFGIGVELIDNAHQELFRIVRRLFIFNQNKKKKEDPSKNMWIAEEGIKFLKVYTLRHFREEEDYMRSIGYRELERHLAQHSYLRDKVVPRIEMHLQHSQYSPEAMDKFLSIMTLWLTRHILQHDKAIAWEKASPAAI